MGGRARHQRVQAGVAQDPAAIARTEAVTFQRQDGHAEPEGLQGSRRTVARERVQREVDAAVQRTVVGQRQQSVQFQPGRVDPGRGEPLAQPGLSPTFRHGDHNQAAVGHQDEEFGPQIERTGGELGEVVE